jgi:outer membrane receptor for ferrienterochelin and colicins
VPRHLLNLLSLCILSAGTMANAAPVDDEEDLALTYGDAQTVSITTGVNQPIRRAPAVATVITARDIQTMGATDLNQVLESVPGVHVSHSNMAYAPIFAIRGISTQYNPQVLVLTNGIPMTSIFVGDRGLVWGGYPVENIARIEIIRGPGSALYGADAYSGVINIITKTATDIDGTELGVRAGSYHSADSWLLHGGKWGEVAVATYLSVGTTEGARETIAADAQTGLDALFGSHASLAPGPTYLGYKWTDAAVDLSYRHWRLRSSIKERRQLQNGPGIAQAIDPAGANYGRRLTTDLTYQDPELARDWDLTLQASYFDLNERDDLMLYPPGAFGGAFPDGMFGNPYKWERRARLTATAFYTGLDQHRFRIGGGYENSELYRVEETKNYRFVYVPGVGNVPVPLGSMQHASRSDAFMTPHSRQLGYIYLQDEWQLAPDWTLTGGIRSDHYSDFGTTTNPRLALVWEAGYNVTAKLLTGRAFRAPSFAELYNINNPVALGNPNLRPETIATVEAALAWRPSATLTLSGNAYRYQMHDIIRFVANEDPTTGATAQNSGSQTGHGLEFETSWIASRALRLSGNYAYQRPTTPIDSSDAAAHHLYVRADWAFANRWSASTQLNWIAGRNRLAGDSRAEISDYRTLDIALQRLSSFDQRWDATLAVRNLLNADVREPSLSPGSLVDDLPMPGRNLSLQVRFFF